MLYVDPEACTGCAMCVDICPTGAISLNQSSDQDERVAAIDITLCDKCLECLEVCVNDAIQLAESFDLVPAEEVEVVEGEIIGSEVVPAPITIPTLKTRQPNHLVALAGTALASVGSWLLPRAADVLLNAVERQLVDGGSTAPSATRIRTGSRSLGRQTGSGQGRRYRQRRRRRQGK